MIKTVHHRLATSEDILPIMALYHKTGSGLTQDQLFQDFQKLKFAVESTESIWFVSEKQGKLYALISVLIDSLQGLAKISRIMVEPCEQSNIIVRELLRYVLIHLQENLTDVEVIYTTTLTIPLHAQEITVLEGFKIMGVFPNAVGADQSKLNGLTVFYKDEVIRQKRHSNFRLHPVIRPFFNICLKQMNLKLPLFEKTPSSIPQVDYDPVPPLEIIHAPLLVERKFRKLLEHQSQIINFYPFYKPNTLICDPDQEVEIYVKISENINFAAIIGEHLEKTVNPVALYSAVLQLLRQQKVSYVEIINDAADIYGTQYILDATFTPCAYIPAFKRQGETRRDYVVFGKSFEYLCQPDLNIGKHYLEFFKQYFKLERRNYFRKSSLD